LRLHMQLCRKKLGIINLHVSFDHDNTKDKSAVSLRSRCRGKRKQSLHYKCRITLGNIQALMKKLVFVLMIELLWAILEDF